MLKDCPECRLQVSDKAFTCPHCGYPLKENINAPIRRYSKRKRLPNGFGQITELKNRNLRKPFRAMVTVGFSEYGKPIQKLLRPQAYFGTYNEAYMALLEAHRNPYDANKDVVLADIFAKWYADIKDKKSSSNRYIMPSWERCNSLHSIKVADIKPYYISDLIKNADETPANKHSMKRLLNALFDYAVEYDYIQSNPARNAKLISNINEESEPIHNNFTDEEIKALFGNAEDYYFVKVILIQCYMGWRPAEMCNLKKSDVNLNEISITGGMKTKYGKNRKVPVHSVIIPYVKEFYDRSPNEYLFNIYDGKHNNDGEPMDYNFYVKRFNRVMEMLKLKPHKPHDPRVFFVSTCKKYKVDEWAIKHFIGHSIKDITEGVYTRREYQWYKDEIEKIKSPC